MEPVGEPQGDGDVCAASRGGADKPHKTLLKTDRSEGREGRERPARRLPSRTHEAPSRAKARQTHGRRPREEHHRRRSRRTSPARSSNRRKSKTRRAGRSGASTPQQAESEIAETVRKINGEQKKEVLANLPAAISKAIDPKDLFNIDKWIAITTDAVTPIMENLFEHQARIGGGRDRQARAQSLQ